MKLADYLREQEIRPPDFARMLGVNQGLLHQWLSGDRPIAAHQCPRIEKATNGKVRCEDLNDKVDWAFVRGTAEAA